ncbi:MAG: hypothetical protein F4Z55_13550 [Boseongicola sp. SB0667_bin_21]|nr:hypothetical protein [Boseongicola sp. SB0667_bin_21]
MLERLWDRATVLAVIGLIVVVWVQLRSENRANVQAITDARVETLREIADAREKTLEAIINLSQQVATVDKTVTVVETVVKPLVPKIEENIRNTDANKDDIDRLEQLIKELKGSEL